jgi:radical S-adenosyl methionine domain-containing protein 2
MRIFSALLWLCYKLTTVLKNIKNLCSFFVYSQQCPAATANSVKPRSVNYHLTRQCNYQCGFCFHTAKTSFVLPIDEAKKGLRMLKDAG